MNESERIVAVALLTNKELRAIGNALDHVLPIEEIPSEFAELLAKIDEAYAEQPKD